MGLLDEIYTQQPGLLSSGNRLSGLLGEPINPIARRNRLADFGAPVPQADMRWLNEYMGNVLAGKYAKQGVTDFVNAVTSNDPKQMLDYLGPGAIGKAGAVLQTAFHGSPHKFDQFDMSKIGTGEGAQAYGHGLYFSESPEVAKSYKDMVPVNSRTNFQDLFIPNSDALNNLRGTATSRRLNKIKNEFGEYSHEYLSELKKKAISDIDFYIPQSKTPDHLLTVKNEINKASLDDIASMINGNLYKVDIPDEAVSKMLDWDKPLSEQPQNVQDMMKKVFSAAGIPDAWKMDPDGNSARAWVQSALGDEGSRKAMLEAGIPGIKYFDGSSRAAGEGTRNFVVFDDKLPKIIERK